MLRDTEPGGLRPEHREAKMAAAHLDIEQPELEVGHGFLSQGQVPDHHIQGLVREEALVDGGHAGRAPNVPDVKLHGFNLLEQQGTEWGHLSDRGGGVVTEPQENLQRGMHLRKTWPMEKLQTPVRPN